MDEIDWETVRDEFAFDGSWRDIYVFGTTSADWQRILDAIQSAGYRFTYFRALQPTELPTNATNAFPLPDQCDRHLSVWFADVLANCHFFTVEEIEFDIDPREVKGQHELNALFGFMRCLAQATEKEVVLTPENAPEIVIFRVSPGKTAIEYQPPRPPSFENFFQILARFFAQFAIYLLGSSFELGKTGLKPGT